MSTRFIGVYGKTCAGKRTLGEYLSSVMDCRYISFGDHKRDEIAKRTETGAQIEEHLRLKEQIPPHLGYRVVGGAIQRGLNIISGYPISLDEFELISSRCPMVGLVLLHVNESEQKRRFTLRRECPKCHKLGMEGDVCPVDKAKMVCRQDANVEELAKRRVLYEHRIAEFLLLSPITEIPRLVLDTSGLTREEVGKRTESWIEQLHTRD